MMMVMMYDCGNYNDNIDEDDVFNNDNDNDDDDGDEDDDDNFIPP